MIQLAPFSVSLMLRLCCAGLTEQDGAAGSQSQVDFVRLMNQAKGRIENREASEAIELLSSALRLKPKSAPALRNMGRAHLLSRAHTAALDVLQKARAADPESAATAYLTGLALLREARFSDAIPVLERAARLDPRTATVRFQLSSAYQAAGRNQPALEQLRETLRLDPLHGSAHYKLAMQARKSGNREEFQNHIRDFTRLRAIFGDATQSATALEQCVHTMPEAAAAQKPQTPAVEAGARIPVRFIDASAQVFGAVADRRASAVCVLESDAAGEYTLFVVDPDGVAGLLNMKGGRFERKALQLDSPLSGRVRACIPGNFHDEVPGGARFDPKIHSRNDVLLIGAEGIRLLERTTEGSFRDVTERAGLSNLAARTACWVDYEHDGDLDLLLARETQLELWQNNGNGTFKNVTTEVGIPATGPVTDIGVGDLDGNIAVDIVAARGEEPTLVFLNQRAGRFEALRQPPGPWQSAGLVAVDDFTNDGRLDAFMLSVRGAFVHSFDAPMRRGPDIGAIHVADMAVFDFDNDGWLDVFVAGSATGTAARGALRLLWSAGTSASADVTAAAGLDSLDVPPVRAIAQGDFDGDGDTDLLLTTVDEQLVYLRNEGGHVNGQLKLRLIPTKTNHSGFGTRVELRSGEFWLTRAVEAVPIELGLGGRGRIDTVQTVWTNGVVQTEVDLAPGAGPLEIVEKNVPTGSCPFLYAWDGAGFRFVTDILGNAPVGLPLTRDRLLPTDPDEFVLIGPDDAFPKRDDGYVLEVTSEFREVTYLDQVRLVAIDHPTGSEVHATDKLMWPPFPKSELWVLHARRALRSVGASDGADRSEALAEIDGRFAPPGIPRPPQLRGQCYPLALELDFGELDVSRPLVLALTGWLQYGDASTNVAMSQDATLTVIPPTLEVEAPGGWQRVEVSVGMPAGKTKTILVDLRDKLPHDATRLRLTTTFEIRWDRIALFERLNDTQARTHVLSLREARLYFRGFSDLTTPAAGHPLIPVYETVAKRPPWRTTPEGWCTRYGEVTELASQRDGQLILLNAGDALRLTFDGEGLPPPGPDQARTFAFYSFGWCKDTDHNVLRSEQVGPLSDLVDEHGRPMVESAGDWRLRYNTRWVPRDQFGRHR